MSPGKAAVKPASALAQPTLVNPGEKAEFSVTQAPPNAKNIHAARQPARQAL
jgi:hypothetical protein